MEENKEEVLDKVNVYWCYNLAYNNFRMVVCLNGEPKSRYESKHLDDLLLNAIKDIFYFCPDKGVHLMPQLYDNDMFKTDNS